MLSWLKCTQKLAVRDGTQTTVEDNAITQNYVSNYVFLLGLPVHTRMTRATSTPRISLYCVSPFFHLQKPKTCCSKYKCDMVLAEPVMLLVSVKDAVREVCFFHVTKPPCTDLPSCLSRLSHVFQYKCKN